MATPSVRVVVLLCAVEAAMLWAYLKQPACGTSVPTLETIERRVALTAGDVDIQDPSRNTNIMIKETITSSSVSSPKFSTVSAAIGMVTKTAPTVTETTAVQGTTFCANTRSICNCNGTILLGTSAQGKWAAREAWGEAVPCVKTNFHDMSSMQATENAPHVCRCRPRSGAELIPYRTVHICGRHFSPQVSDMIVKDLNYISVDAYHDPTWDMIYGGYPHCGTKDHEWDMGTGLVPTISFESLKPYQMWFPCMGCRWSYCNKRELCSKLRALDPEACYVLPEDYERIKSKMGGDRIWVLKRDVQSLNLHAGAGIKYIGNPSELPTNIKESDGYLVMPYVDTFVGEGKYQRKMEFRIYLTVTSTYPLRLYAHNHTWVLMAAQVYSKDAAKANKSNAKCIRDTHSNNDCNRKAGAMKEDDLMLHMDNYSRGVGWDATIVKMLTARAQKLLAGVIYGSNPTIQKHRINKGINASGASCFSLMRADMGVTEDLKPTIFEINELPWTGHEQREIKPIIRDVHRDMFHMIGADLSREERMAITDRAKYELAHLGGWKLLEDPR